VVTEGAGLDRTYIRGIERKVKNPNVTVVERIAEAVGCTLGALLDWLHTSSTSHIGAANLTPMAIMLVSHDLQPSRHRNPRHWRSISPEITQFETGM
jgi:transcriptional regulator with XRE-family HTH domain